MLKVNALPENRSKMIRKEKRIGKTEIMMQISKRIRANKIASTGNMHQEIYSAPIRRGGYIFEKPSAATLFESNLLIFCTLAPYSFCCRGYSLLTKS